MLVGFLLRNRVGLPQIRPAVGGDLRQLQRRLDLLAAGPGLREFLVDFRSVNRRQQFALLNLASHVLVPAQKVAVGARKNRRLFKGLQISGQHQFVVSGLGLRLHHGDSRNRDGFRFFRQRVGFALPVQKRNCAGGDQDEQHGANQNLARPAGAGAAGPAGRSI